MTDQLQTASVDAADFARSVASTSDDQLAEGLRSEFRRQILDEIFGRMETHFEPARAHGLDAVVRFRITGPEGEPDRYEATIRDGACRVTRDPAGFVDRPRVTLTVGDVEFLKLVTGNADGPGLFLRRKLQVNGDLMFAARVASLFRIPRADA